MKLVYVKKYGDAIPVQLRQPDWESHLESLAQTHGESAIVLESGKILAEERQPERDRQEREAAEAAEAERVRLEAEELAKNPTQSDDAGGEGGAGSQESGEPVPSSDEQKPEVAPEAPAPEKKSRAQETAAASRVA